jgi:hypothetical protein
MIPKSPKPRSSITGEPLTTQEIDAGRQNMLAYYDVWYDIFGGLLGWSQEKVEQWAERFKSRDSKSGYEIDPGQYFLEDPNDLINHDHAMYWAVNFFAPDDLANHFNYELSDQFGSEIEALLHAHSDDEHGFTFKKTNWELVKKEYSELVKKYWELVQIKGN